MKNKTIKKNTPLIELLNNEKVAEVLFNSGLMCLGCSMAMYETLGQGCVAHGMSKKEVDKLIKKLNEIK